MNVSEGYVGRKEFIPIEDVYVVCVHVRVCRCVGAYLVGWGERERKSNGVLISQSKKLKLSE